MGFEVLLVVVFAIAGLGVVLFSAAGKAKKSAQATTPTRVGETQPEFQQFKQKTAEEPQEPRHWLQWGHALVLSARKGGSLNMKLHRYNEACSCYRQAAELAPTFVPAWISWGITLYELFRVQKCSDIFLLEGGHNKFQTALDLSPRTAKLWVQWGTELKNLSAAVGSDQCKIILGMAEECFAKAAELDANVVGAAEASVPVAAPASPVAGGAGLAPGPVAAVLGAGVPLVAEPSEPSF